MDEVGLTLRQASHTQWCQMLHEVDFDTVFFPSSAKWSTKQ